MNMPIGESFLTTMDYMDYPEYKRRGHLLKRQKNGIIGQLKFAWKICKVAKTQKILLLDSSSGSIQPDLLATIIIGFWRKVDRPMIIMLGALWQKDSGIRGLVQKFMLKLADKSIFRYASIAKNQAIVFSETWGIPETKLKFLPYFYTFTKEDLNSPPPPLEDFIFSGGNSHRDYTNLLKAIKALPTHKFFIASYLLDGVKLPPNVQARQTSRHEFIKLMRSSKAVIIPILSGLTRSTAQQTYLNALLLEKPVIVTDALGVRDHLNNEIAFIVDGSPESYIKAIEEIYNLENQEKIKKMTKMARQIVFQEFSFEKHCERLLKIMDEAYEEFVKTK